MQSFAGESESPVSGAPLGTMLPPQAPIGVGKRWLAHMAPGPRRCCPKHEGALAVASLSCHPLQLKVDTPGDTIYIHH